MGKTEDNGTVLSVDFHTHLLPGMDDGSVSPAESRAMLDAMTADAVEAAVLTPHFYPDRESPDEFLARREKALEALLGVLRPSDPRLYLGAEVAYYEGIAASRELSKLCIRGTSCLLLELPFDKTLCSTVYRNLEMMINRGLRVVIAHVERYPACRRKSVRRRLEDMGLIMQSNAEGFIDRSTAHRMHRLWKHGEIDLLGSDCHHAVRRAPNLGGAVAALQKCGQTDALRKAFDRSRRLLSGAWALGES